jgi:hypothetical protein
MRLLGLLLGMIYINLGPIQFQSYTMDRFSEITESERTLKRVLLILLQEHIGRLNHSLVVTLLCAITELTIVPVKFAQHSRGENDPV